MPNTAIGLAEEKLSADEPAIVEKLVDLNLGGVQDEPGAAKRAQHTKHLGVVQAKFVVSAGIPEHLRTGLFSQPREFDAIIRFSSGRQTDDRKGDAHGMAIKLLDVPGPKLLAGRENETTHDFVLVDNEVFFLRDMAEYLSFNESAAQAKKSKIRGFIFLAKLALVQRDLGRRVKSFAGKTPSSPLASHYWSTTPYRLGGHAVKYMAVSPNAGTAKSNSGVQHEDGLVNALASELALEAATFDFGVHVQSDASRQPVEDATVNWRDNGAQFVKLARIEIPLQLVKTNETLAEDLVFSPWHAIEEHRPLGAINRARRDVYAAMSKRRHQLNGVTPSGSSEVLRR